MRLFIAFKLSDKARNALIDYQNYLKSKGIRGNYSTRENLHITIAFIGEVDIKTFSMIKEAIKGYQFERVNINVNGVGAFNESIHACVDKSTIVDKIALDIRKILDSIGVDYSKSKFKSHITILRQPNMSLKEAIEERSINFKEELDEIILYESTRINGKLTYIEKLNLEGKNG